MPPLLKDLYNKEFFEQLIKSLKEAHPEFQEKLFLKDIYTKDWIAKELKQRMRHITTTLEKHLSKNFTKNVELILNLIPILKKNGIQPGNLECLFLPDFIEVYGIDENYEVAIKAMEGITKFVSCEFAVRPFIIKYPKQMLEQMLTWSKHKDPMVRRLASEGSRPRLPWGMSIPALKENPAPILPILKNLQNDPSESVRRSAANNLNDISKDHSQQVIDLAKAWKGQSKEKDALIKHACRTLLKQGNPEIMQLFGFVATIKATELKVLSPTVEIGAALEFSFKISTETRSKIRLEYSIYYQKANGTLTKKVYKISETLSPEKSTREIHKRHSFRQITTRKFYAGKHQVSVIINGQESEKIDFILKEVKPCQTSKPSM